MTLEKRFWEKVDRRGPDECWPWTGWVNRGGYGRFKLDQATTVAAHRQAYLLEVGPIPTGLTLDHLCRNRACCNPAHLEPVTNKVNVLRGEGPTALNARQTVCKEGHPLEGDNLMVTPQGYRRCRECHRQWDRRWRKQQVADGRRQSTDLCPECGGLKKKQAARCLACYKAARRAALPAPQGDA